MFGSIGRPAYKKMSRARGRTSPAPSLQAVGFTSLNSEEAAYLRLLERSVFVTLSLYVGPQMSLSFID